MVKIHLRLSLINSYLKKDNLPSAVFCMENDFTIYVEVKGGIVQSIYGPTLIEPINFIVRDMDDIGDVYPDPLPIDYEPKMYYW